MAKKEIDQLNLEIDSNEEIINDNFITNLKEEYCQVLWIKPHAFAINFQGYGISFHVRQNHDLDIEKIKNPIKVKYKSEIGLSDFEIYPIYQ